MRAVTINFVATPISRFFSSNIDFFRYAPLFFRYDMVNYRASLVLTHNLYSWFLLRALIHPRLILRKDIHNRHNLLPTHKVIISTKVLFLTEQNLFTIVLAYPIDETKTLRVGVVVVCRCRPPFMETV